MESHTSSSTTTTTTTTRKPCFVGEDHGLASITHFSTTKTNNNYNNNNNGYFVDYQNHMMRRRNSLRNISSFPSNDSVSSSTSASVSTISLTTNSFSPRSARFYDPRFEEVYTPHFLESCALCHKPLGGNRDIFMYRGDTPFCSEECRQEQIDIDDAKEKNWNLKALRSKKDAKKSSSTKAQNYSFRTGTVAAA